MYDNICAEVAETNQKGKVLTEIYTLLPILCAHTIASSSRYERASNYWNCENVYGQKARKCMVQGSAVVFQENIVTSTQPLLKIIVLIVIAQGLKS